MKFNKIIFILMIAATIIFAGMIGSSYAYYALTDTSIDVTTGNVTNGFSIVFSDNNYVNVKTGVPLNDDQVIESAKASDILSCSSSEKNISVCSFSPSLSFTTSCKNFLTFSLLGKNLSIIHSFIL